LYAGPEDFLTRTTGFIGAALDEGAAVLVVVDEPKIAWLRRALGPAAAGRVGFADMRVVGRNPARIIPAWRAFVDEHGAGGRPLRGIGEPAVPGRSVDALVECRHHEALLNVAFASAQDFWLLCPYDTATLDPAIVGDVHDTHPAPGAPIGVDVGDLLAEPLPPPGDTVALWPLRLPLVSVRHEAARYARATGFGSRADDVELVVDELTTNSLRYGRTGGTLRMWPAAGLLVCEVADGGTITDPLVGRRRPRRGQLGGRGLWMVNQMCDLVQIRSSPGRAVVRAHLSRDAA
jgi:anti-sigma regulatory factor (Ser/Thr protein kinase)